MKMIPLSAQLRSLAADLLEELGPDHRALAQLEGAAAIVDVAAARGAQLIAAWDAEAEAADAARPGTGRGELLAAQRALIWGSAALGVEALIRLLGVGLAAAPAPPAPTPAPDPVPERIEVLAARQRLARWALRRRSVVLPQGAGR